MSSKFRSQAGNKSIQVCLDGETLLNVSFFIAELYARINSHKSINRHIGNRYITEFSDQCAHYWVIQIPNTPTISTHQSEVQAAFMSPPLPKKCLGVTKCSLIKFNKHTKNSMLIDRPSVFGHTKKTKAKSMPFMFCLARLESTSSIASLCPHLSTAFYTFFCVQQSAFTN